METRYDAADREVMKIHPPDQNGATAQVSTLYLPLKNTVTDENANSKTFVQDGLERLIEVQEQNDNATYITRYEYDPLENLTKITDAHNNVKTMTYDGLKRKTFMNDPDRGRMLYQYDAAGNLVRTTDNKGQVILYSYDGANRLLSEDYQDANGFTPDVSYHYDLPPTDSPDAANLKGKLAQIEDLSGALFFSYDARGNPVRTIKRIRDGAFRADYQTDTTYDAMDRVVSMTYPDGDQIRYTYNSRSLLDTVPGIVSGIDYHASGQIASIDYANGIRTSYTYDPRQRLTHLRTSNVPQENTVLQDLSYTMDGVGNITAIADGRSLPADAPQNASQTFRYDDLYRLTGAEGPGYGSILFGYDAIGNLTFKKSPEAPDLQHIDDALVNLGALSYGGIGGSSNRTGKNPGAPPGPHAVTGTKSGLLYDYDDNGNMISHAAGDLYSWDFKDRLIRARQGETDTRYVYDHQGQRVLKKVQKNNELQTTLYISNAFEIREGKTIKTIFAGNRRVAQVEGRLPATGALTQQTLRFQSGWNFFSLDVEPENPALTSVLSSIAGNYTEVWTFDPATNTYKGHAPAENLNDLQELHAHRGYLIHITTPTPLLVFGTQTTTTLSLPPGWNLIACPTGGESLPIPEALASIDRKYQSVWSFDPATQTWQLFDPSRPTFLNDLTLMEPGKAYWVEMKTEGQLTYTPQPADIHFYHPDHLGSSGVVTDENGAVVERTEFYPYGRPRYEERNGFESAYKYTGKELDSETSLYNYDARLYDPAIGRFISADNVIPNWYDPQFLNLYAYCLNNPLVYVDPNGHDVVLVIGGPYAKHHYGHVALRVYGNGYDKTYDFGRYHGGRGIFGETGDGVLRVWNNFDKYIAEEKNTGRVSTGYTFDTDEAQDKKIMEQFEKNISGLKSEKTRHGDDMQQYKLKEDYHWGRNNCTTMSKEAFESGTGIELGEDTTGKGLNLYEKTVAKANGWPDKTFMPADLKNILDKRKDVEKQEWKE